MTPQSRSVRPTALSACLASSREALDRSARLLAEAPDPWPAAPAVIRRRFHVEGAGALGLRDGVARDASRAAANGPNLAKSRFSRSAGLD